MERRQLEYFVAVVEHGGFSAAARARLVLRDLDALRAAARTLGEGVSGRVEVAATSSSGLEPVTGVVAELRERHPGITVSTTSALSAVEVVAMVRHGRCEAGVCGSAERPAGRGIVAHHLRDEEFLLVVPPGTLSGAGPTVRREVLHGMRFVLPAPATAVRTLFDRLSGSVGGMSVAAEVGDRSMVLP